MADKQLNLEVINEKLALLGLSRTDLAKKLGVSKEAVSQWLKGSKFPRPAKLLSLAKILQLKYSEAVIIDISKEPIVAFRTNKKKKQTEAQTAIAKDMGKILELVVPYLNRETVFPPPTIQNPQSDDFYIQKAAGELRTRLDLDGYELPFKKIMNLYEDFRIILIPVLWGRNGDNGLFIHLPVSSLTFVYINLEKVVTDFKFWLLHELAHAITPGLQGVEADIFADKFSAAMLFPRKLAGLHYAEVSKIPHPGTAINLIKSIASNLLISPFTILNEMNRFAQAEGLPSLNYELGGVVTNFNKQVGLVSEIIFGQENPEPERYIKVCEDVFGTSFFAALSQYINSQSKEFGVVQRLLNIPLADAKGVYEVLATQ